MQLSHWYLSQSACEVEKATVKFKIYNHQVGLLFKLKNNDVEQSL